MVTSTYNPALVALSLGMAIVASFTALGLARRVATSTGATARAWLAAGAFSMGIGIWAMHFIGMLALDVEMTLQYDPWITLVSLIVAIAAAALLILIGTQATLFFDYNLNSQERFGEKLQALLAERTSTLERQTAYLRASTDQLRREVEENRRLSVIVEQATTAISVTNAQGRIEYANPQFEREFGYSLSELRGKTAVEMGWSRSQPAVHDEILATALRGETWSGHVRSTSRDGKIIDHDVVVSPILNAERHVTRYVEIRRDVTERLRLEQQLRQAQKLEAIGQLAAGIAHEINTPAQYVGDNTRFLEDAFGGLGTLVDGVKRLAGATAPVESDVLKALLDQADADYLMTEIPRAIEQSLEGIGRITRIVRAMKELSHPAQDKALVDLNRAIESTITVATNEWKYVADVELDLDKSLPQVSCMPGDVNQVVLNMIVNAAHAIDEANAGSTRRGTITVATRLVGDSAEVRISDTGTGIPDEIRERIFDPFFTTKSVGQGTGQGLSIAHTVIVEKHGGSIAVESKPGEGACFIIRLPLEGPAKGSVAA